MKAFKYTDTLDMEPRYGNKFGTRYYKLDNKQTARLTDFIKTIKELVDEDINLNNNWSEWNEPDTNYRRVGKSANYSKYQIINDLHDQLQKGNDPTKGLIGRWNRLFKDTAYEFKLKED